MPFRIYKTFICPILASAMITFNKQALLIADILVQYDLVLHLFFVFHNGCI